MKSPQDESELRFSKPSGLAKTALVLPHSNADPERLFSMVKKIETSQRSHLKAETTSNLISCKYNNPAACFEGSSLMTPAFLKRANVATTASLATSVSGARDAADAGEEAGDGELL